MLGDTHGNLVHLFERDCSIQRRNQKVVERAPAPYLDDAHARRSCATPRSQIGRATDYVGAGTVEFLMDADTGDFYFIEVNPRIQVEHTVTEVVTGIDIVKAQIRIARGRPPSATLEETGVPAQAEIRLERPRAAVPHHHRGPREQLHPRLRPHHRLSRRLRLRHPRRRRHRLFRRGRHALLRSAAGEGHRLGADARGGDRAHGPRAARVPHPRRRHQPRLPRNVISHPKFRANDLHDPVHRRRRRSCSQSGKRQDRATKLLTYIADVTVNGHPETRGRAAAAGRRAPPVSRRASTARPAAGTRQLLRRARPEGLRRLDARRRQRVLVTDTTMRDAHQSLLATRMRTLRHRRRSPAPMRAALPQLLSLECWGGATFDVAMRFLTEDPWERLALMRERGAQHPAADAAARRQRRRLHQLSRQCRAPLRRAGGARPASTCSASSTASTGSRTCASRSTRSVESGKLVEGAICYTGDILDPARAKYALDLLRRPRQGAGGGRLPHPRPSRTWRACSSPPRRGCWSRRCARRSACRSTSTPTTPPASSAATVLAAVEAGVDAVDAAMDAMSGATSQPCLGSIVEALRRTDARHRPRRRGDPPDLSFYWEAVRSQYAAFESDLKAGASEVYLHEMPGGQFTNLKEQARSLGLETRWHEVAAGLSRRQRHVRRHRQGDAVVQGRRRHGADDGRAGAERRRRARSGARRSPSRPRSSRCCAAISASRRAAGRRRCRRRR